MELRAWQTALLDQLENSGTDAQAIAKFIRRRRIRIGFRAAPPAVNAFWYVDGNIYLNNAFHSLNSPVTDPRILCLVMHEAYHLRQGPFTALSIYGELEAWQMDFRLYNQLTLNSPGGPLGELLSLQLSWDRATLQRARVLMRAYAGKGYRADLLPLYPWGKEISWWLMRTRPR